jgi:hypothetical protein
MNHTPLLTRASGRWFCHRAISSLRQQVLPPTSLPKGKAPATHHFQILTGDTPIAAATSALLMNLIGVVVLCCAGDSSSLSLLTRSILGRGSGGRRLILGDFIRLLRFEERRTGFGKIKAAQRSVARSDSHLHLTAFPSKGKSKWPRCPSKVVGGSMAVERHGP